MSIDSPCRATCRLNPQDICIGCYRHMSEIAGWNKCSEQQRRFIIDSAAKRRLANPYRNQDKTLTRPITGKLFSLFRKKYINECHQSEN